MKTLGDLKWGDMFEFADREHLSSWTIYRFLGISPSGWATYETHMTSGLGGKETAFTDNLQRHVKSVTDS